MIPLTILLRLVSLPLSQSAAWLWLISIYRPTLILSSGISSFAAPALQLSMKRDVDVVVLEPSSSSLPLSRVEPIPIPWMLMPLDRRLSVKSLNCGTDEQIILIHWITWLYSMTVHELNMDSLEEATRWLKISWQMMAAMTLQMGVNTRLDRSRNLISIETQNSMISQATDRICSTASIYFII